MARISKFKEELHLREPKRLLALSVWYNRSGPVSVDKVQYTALCFGDVKTVRITSTERQLFAANEHGCVRCDFIHKNMINTVNRTPMDWFGLVGHPCCPAGKHPMGMRKRREATGAVPLR